MTKLDYGTQLSPGPITFLVGDVILQIKKPQLREIADITFQLFIIFEEYLKLTPELFYTKILDKEEYWNGLSLEERDAISIIDICSEYQEIAQIYEKILSFFLDEPVIFGEGAFIILNHELDENEELIPANVKFVIKGKILNYVISICKQVCVMDTDDDEDINEMKFKNEAARKLYERLHAAKKKQKAKKTTDINLTLPNIISVVSNNHPSINPINVWDLTLFQLFDAFNRLQLDKIYNIDSTRVSVWGDEKKKFDPAFWYKNEYDKPQSSS